MALEKNSVGVNELIISCSRTVNLCYTKRYHCTTPNPVFQRTLVLHKSWRSSSR